MALHPILARSEIELLLMLNGYAMFEALKAAGERVGQSGSSVHERP